MERLVLKGTEQQPTQVVGTLTPPTARMVLTPPTARMGMTPPTVSMGMTPPIVRKVSRVKLVSRWLIQRGRDQIRRQLLQRKRYSATNGACDRTVTVFHYLSLLCGTCVITVWHICHYCVTRLSFTAWYSFSWAHCESFSKSFLFPLPHLLFPLASRYSLPLSLSALYTASRLPQLTKPVKGVQSHLPQKKKGSL